MNTMKISSRVLWRHQLGSGFVQSIILVVVLALGGVAAVRGLGGALRQKADCTGQAIANLDLSVVGCGEAGGAPSDLPLEVADSPATVADTDLVARVAVQQVAEQPIVRFAAAGSLATENDPPPGDPEPIGPLPEPGPFDPGRQRVELYIGQEVHKAIEAYYLQHHPDEMVLTEATIKRILDSLLGRGVRIPNPFIGVRRAGRVDIINLTTHEIYEIKSINEGTEGAVSQITDYIVQIFAESGQRHLFTPGTSSDPGVSGVVPAPGGWAVFSSPRPGVILYRYYPESSPPQLPLPRRPSSFDQNERRRHEREAERQRQADMIRPQFGPFGEETNPGSTGLEPSLTFCSIFAGGFLACPEQ